ALLHELRVLERVRPRHWRGSGPYHFALGPNGAAIVAANLGLEVRDLPWRRDAIAGLERSQRLAHLVGTNGFFTALVRSARHRAGCQLAEWWSEARCAAAWGEVVRPDGYGVWAEDGDRLPFLLEYDTGSEQLTRLGAKLPGYARLAKAAGHPTWVLFALGSVSREAGARRELAHPGVPVATAVLRPGGAPDGPVWLPVGDSGPRRRLIDLGHPSRALRQRRPA
ncbi:MAG TPA: replication-relaxation family protein, partial [Acidimicrobiales bacterium]|nr:replication-relaxation family protein [Acidimicrobiales bacterium]